MISVICADPPWRHANKWGKHGAAHHYETMSLADLCAYPIPDVGKPAVLFLWALENMREEAHAVGRAWGFRYKTALIWDKVTKTGKPWFGQGYYFRGAHEPCLLFTRGAGCRPAVSNVRSRFTAQVGRHSEKPDHFYELVRTMYPRATYYELFARRIRRGWIQSGNELGKLGETA